MDTQRCLWSCFATKNGEWEYKFWWGVGSPPSSPILDSPGWYLQLVYLSSPECTNSCIWKSTIPSIPFYQTIKSHPEPSIIIILTLLLQMSLQMILPHMVTGLDFYHIYNRRLITTDQCYICLTFFKLRIGALISRSVCLSVGQSVCPPKITKLYKTSQNITKHW